MFPCNEYLKLAKEWANASDEAYLRCAISRAYYACFNLIKEYGEQNNVRFSKKGIAHNEVIKFLKNNTDPKIKSLYRIQERLRKNRAECDYDKKVVGINIKARKAIIESNKIFSVIKI